MKATRLSNKQAELKDFLDEKVLLFNTRAFIEDDPVSIPHRYSFQGDIEVAAFLTATISWGNRKSIITNASKLMRMMDESPHGFIIGHSAAELKTLKNFVHRTFNGDDLIGFVKCLRMLYQENSTLEIYFEAAMKQHGNSCVAISEFRNAFFKCNHPARMEKHVSDPLAGSAAKRINMFLRWMVRNDQNGVDFGIWKKISPAWLSIPLDVHSGNTARKLELLERKQNDQKAVIELDRALRMFDPNDPIKYDYALFGLGAIEKF